MYDVIVVGAGPSGMTAAICAADTRIYRAFHPSCDLSGKENKKNVLLLEKNKKIGKKLYATGNGRCNVSNAAFDLSCYHSKNEFFPFQTVGRDDYITVNKFLEQLGVLVSDERGYFYPLARQASAVAWGFTDRLKANGIEIHTGETVCDIRQIDDMWQITTDVCRYETGKVVLSCGSPASPSLGGTFAGYELLEQLELPIHPFQPALCKLSCAEDIRTLHGVRADAEISIRQSADDSVIFRERGEVQFTETGLSGIVMFNASCYVNVLMASAKNTVSAEIALLPELAEEELYKKLEMCARENANRTAFAVLNGFVHEKLAAYLLADSMYAGHGINEMTKEDIRALAHTMKHLTFTVTGTAGFADAQAALGGADTGFVASDTLKSKIKDNIYIVGELLDVCGKCGGYNLTWAILTGMKAGFDIYDSDQ